MGKPKISLVIPYWEINPDKKKILERCLTSLEGEYDELILVDEVIHNLSTKINKGLKRAKGDFIIVCNDDIVLDKGHLSDLCVEGEVVSPYVNNNKTKTFHAHMWCIPRAVYEKVGPMFEGYDGWYYDDTDYMMQIRSKGVPLKITDKVNILHLHPASTIGNFDNRQREENNKRLFHSRWGAIPNEYE